MPAGTAQRRCAAIVADFDIPRPFDLGRFLDQVAARRGRRIFLHPFTSGPGIPCGLWLSTPQADHIFHEADTTPWHRTHIVLHELAHMLLGHGSPAGGAVTLADVLVPDVPRALAQFVLGRTIYATKEERDAERLASLVLGLASAPAPARSATGTEAASVLGRLQVACG